MNFDFLIELHKDGERQGPGSEGATQLALELSGLKNRPSSLQIADIGCGTGASTMVLANELDAKITAIDLFPDFLEALEQNAIEKKVSDKIQTQCISMDALPFGKESLDAIWSEGAIYLIGFEKGVSYFKEFLKPGGILAVSEITWLTSKRPQDVSEFWENAYPEMATASEKQKLLEDQGFQILGYFPLPKECWTENYYTPLLKRMDDFLARHNSEEAHAFIQEEKAEISVFEKYSRYYSYGFYVAEKLE
ncbi:methyltransferase domain-containing protein [Sneathiella sp. P13V-1]|uniref:class I SAM-dependent methyltransferase n=1 Tax=Sneathiella sp. P13V-1 TaxID=2697366 RepID=UPI00187B2459|nr:class I SAM-dependent methyltransferase [Sneathiella sp. P13V-1]MBE7638217.1 methyltransferase domain-containing protein [Sneathiella sp. P13V-1]